MSKTNNIFVKTLAAAVAASTLFAGSVQAFSEDEVIAQKVLVKPSSMSP
ncbi:hypothetical protein [Endozoicomonas atrinae]